MDTETDNELKLYRQRMNTRCTPTRTDIHEDDTRMSPDRHLMDMRHLTYSNQTPKGHLIDTGQSKDGHWTNTGVAFQHQINSRGEMKKQKLNEIQIFQIFRFQ